MKRKMKKNEAKVGNMDDCWEESGENERIMGENKGIKGENEDL